MRQSSNRARRTVRVALVFALASPSVRAADDDSEVLIHYGVKLRDAHHDQEALVLFRRAFELRPTARAQAQIALAEQALGQWIAAETGLEEALATSDPWIVQNRDLLEESRRFVASHLGWLRVSTNVPAVLSLDGTKVDSPPKDGRLRVVAGSLLLRVEADGYAPHEDRVSVGPGESRQVELDLQALPVIAPPAFIASKSAPELAHISQERVALPAAPEPARRRPSFPWAAVGAGAVGLAGIAVGGIFGVKTFDDKAERDRFCTAGRCTPAGLWLDDQGRRDGTVSTIAFVAGAAGLAATAWLFLSWRGEGRASGAPVTPPLAADNRFVWVW